MEHVVLFGWSPSSSIVHRASTMYWAIFRGTLVAVKIQILTHQRGFGVGRGGENCRNKSSKVTKWWEVK